METEIYVQTMQALGKHCLESIPDFREREADALRVIAERSCSLETANWELYRLINNAIADYCYQHDLDPYDYYAEEIFWDYVDETEESCG